MILIVCNEIKNDIGETNVATTFHNISFYALFHRIHLRNFSGILKISIENNCLFNGLDEIIVDFNVYSSHLKCYLIN